MQLILVLAILLVTIYSCANRMPPGGGPYDETPPRLVRSNPENRALNFDKKKVTLYFDEYIKLEDPASKVIISPPQLRNPKISAVGKRVMVELEDDLIDSTTYTLDFTDAIVDNNEGNPLENFSFAFSTGSEIDTMEVSGVVLNMRDHEPMQNILVGIHPADSGWNAFVDTTFMRMSRTSDRAKFVMRNIKHGAYHIYALKENDGNYRHDLPTEGVAFLDSLIHTSSMPAVRNDTIWVDSLTIDTIKEVHYIRYMPDDLVLLYSEPVTARRFLSKRERPDSMQLKLTFNMHPTEVPRLKPLDSLFLTQGVSDSLLPTYYATDYLDGGVVQYFLRDSTWRHYEQFELQYASIDTLYQPTVVRDTLTLKNQKRASATGGQKGTGEAGARGSRGRGTEGADVANDSVPSEAVPSPFTVSIAHKGEGGPSDSIIFTTSLPISEMAFKGVELFNANDSILKPVKIDTIFFLPHRSTSAVVQAKLAYNTSYELYFDSLTFVDIYGHHLDKTAVDAFQTKNRDEFAQLQITISGVEGPFIAELLTPQDGLVRRILAKEKVIKFQDLKPDKYGFRLIWDRNGNGIWDTGSYKDSIQPEMVYYMPKILELMKNWELKETFNPLETPLDQQKPREMIKTKPKEKKRRDLNKQREEEMRRRRQGGNASGMGGFGGGGLGGFGAGGGSMTRF